MLLHSVKWTKWPLFTFNVSGNITGHLKKFDKQLLDRQDIWKSRNFSFPPSNSDTKSHYRVKGKCLDVFFRTNAFTCIQRHIYRQVFTRTTRTRSGMQEMVLFQQNVCSKCHRERHGDCTIHPFHQHSFLAVFTFFSFRFFFFLYFSSFFLLLFVSASNDNQQLILFSKW